MRKQKIIKVGNSYAITIPAEFVKEGNLAVGDELLIESNAQYGTMYIQKEKKNTHTNPKLTPEFFEWLNDFTKRNDKLLTKLAKTPKSNV